MYCQCFFDADCAKYEVGETLIEKNYDCEGTTVLKTKFSFPKVKTTGSAVDYLKINAYYSNLASIYSNTASLELYPTAVEDYRLAQRDGREFFPHEYRADFTQTLKSTQLLSFYIDTMLYQGGAHPTTDRTSQTWLVRTGELLTAKQFFKQDCRYRDIIFNAIKKQADQLAKEGVMFENYEQLLAQYFAPDRFYLDCECLVIYYPLYTIAPYSSGILTFCVRLEDLRPCICEEFLCECQNNPCCRIVCPPLYK